MSDMITLNILLLYSNNIYLFGPVLAPEGFSRVLEFVINSISLSLSPLAFSPFYLSLAVVANNGR